MLKNILLDETPFSDRHAEGFKVFFLINPKGQLLTWGGNPNGQLGLGSITRSEEPQLVKTLENEVLVGIKKFGNIILARTIDGKLYVWGGDGEHAYLGVDKTIANTPQLIQTFVDLGLQCIDVCPIGSGTSSFMALCKDEYGKTSVHVWGKNRDGELGLGDKNPHPFPTILPVNGQPKQILYCYYCNFILCETGVYMFGYDNCYGLSGGDPGNIKQPKMISALKNHEVEKLYRSRLRTMAARTSNGSLRWGEDVENISFEQDIRYIYQIDDNLYYINSRDELSSNQFGAMKKLNLPAMKIAAIFVLPEAEVIISVEGKIFFKGQARLDDMRLCFSDFTDITHLTGRVINMIPNTHFIKTDRDKIYEINTCWPCGINSGWSKRKIMWDNIQLATWKELPMIEEAWEPPQLRPRSVPLGVALHNEKLADQLIDVSFFRGTKQRLWELYASENPVDLTTHTTKNNYSHR